MTISMLKFHAVIVIGKHATFYSANGEILADPIQFLIIEDRTKITVKVIKDRSLITLPLRRTWVISFG